MSRTRPRVSLVRSIAIPRMRARQSRPAVLCGLALADPAGGGTLGSAQRPKETLRDVERFKNFLMQGELIVTTRRGARLQHADQVLHRQHHHAPDQRGGGRRRWRQRARVGRSTVNSSRSAHSSPRSSTSLSSWRRLLPDRRAVSRVHEEARNNRLRRTRTDKDMCVLPVKRPSHRGNEVPALHQRADP